jgi:sporulation protein YlmC with PRC-barrel domain
MPVRKTSILSALVLGIGLVLAGTAFAGGDYGKPGSPPGTTDMKRPLPPGHPPVVLSEKAHRASEFIGRDVENPRGEEIGEVSELILDPETGRVSHAVVSVTGIPEMADWMIAVPFNALNPKPGEENKLVLNIDRERLQAAPGFERDQGPNWTDPNYNAENLRFYGIEPPEGQTISPPHTF